MSANGQPTVLVIDDELGILESLRILLKNEGFNPAIANGGKQGLEQIEELRPDIILSDVRMPLVSGVQVLSAARAQDPDVPVILMTAQATLQSAMQAVNEGAFYYIQSCSATMRCSPFSDVQPSIGNCASRTGPCDRRSLGGNGHRPIGLSGAARRGSTLSSSRRRWRRPNPPS